MTHSEELKQIMDRLEEIQLETNCGEVDLKIEDALAALEDAQAHAKVREDDINEAIATRDHGRYVSQNTLSEAQMGVKL